MFINLDTTFVLINNIKNSWMHLYVQEFLVANIKIKNLLPEVYVLT